MRAAFTLSLCWVGMGFVAPPGRAHAQTGVLIRAEPAAVGLSGEGLGAVGALLDAYVAEGQVAGGVVGVARRGRLVYLHAAGLQDREAGVPMSERSIFRIYSMTRPIVAAGAMLLWEEARFRLDDPVSRYLPGFDQARVVDPPGSAPRPPSRPITVRDLMLHTAGISPRSAPLYLELDVRRRDDTMVRFLDKLVGAPLMEDPGTRFRYGEATTVLGALIEVWSGRPLDEFLEERVLRPLGMVDTGFWVREEQRARLATVYARGPDGALVPTEIEDVPFTERPALLEGTVGLVSSVPDYLRFSQMMLDEGALGDFRLLERETVARLRENGLSEAVLAARSGTMGWGLGNVNIVLDPASVNYPASRGEYGWDGTAGTIFWVDPAEELIIVLMTQSVPANPDGLRQRVKTLVYEAIVP